MPLNNASLGSRIDALLQADNFGLDVWVSAHNAAPFEITYKFETAKASDFPWGNIADPVSYNAAEEAAVERALARFEAVLNIKFVEETGTDDPILSFYSSPDLYTDSDENGGGRGRYGFSWQTNNGVTTYEWDGHVVFNAALDLTAPDKFDLILHEIGHSLGLKHPGNYDLIPGNAPPGPFLSPQEDNNKFTVMSYDENPDSGTYASDLMIYDIAALQKWWGTNDATNKGKTTYRALDDAELKVIYDAGGKDWIRYKGSDTVRIDLREGAFSSLGGVDVAAIAYGTVIENASSGSGGDRLIGNDGANRLIGGAGRDFLVGGRGSDLLKGGKGDDFLVAGKGADKMIGGKGADHFVFNGANNLGRNVITDFKDGRDILRIKNLTMAEVEISATGKGGVNTKVVLDERTEIVLKGVDFNQITASDFDFV